MIKWTGYGKSLKLLFFSLLISCFTLLGNCFVSADNYSLPANFYTNSINNIIGKDLSFESVGTDQVSHNWLYYQFGSNGSNARKYTFWNNGKIYFYADINETNSYYQGYYSCACKVSGSGLNTCSNGCDSSILDEFYNLQDYNFTEIWVYPAGGLTNLCIYNLSNFTTYCFPADNLTGNLGLPDNIIDISEFTENSPFGNGTGNTPIRTGTNNNYICPTIGQLMKNMGENYNTGLCYNNTTYFNGTNFEQVEKQDIFTIFNDNYQEYINRISIYWNNCKTPATNQACQNAFSGEYKKFSIISNAINSNVDEKKLRNYCNFGLNYDPNTTTCVASGGGIKEPYTTEEIIKDITDNGIIVTPKTTGENKNNVTNALNKCENGDRECYINDRNFIESMGNIYGKITGLFKERNGVNGIIPNYILRITFITILFTVIFKK